MIKTYILTIVCILLCLPSLLCCSTIKKEEVPTKLEQQYLLSKIFIAQLPTPSYSHKDNYEEGVVYVYGFSDGAYIIIHEGAMMEFPMDKYEPIEIHKKRKKIIATGVKDGKWWRKDKYRDVRIYYANVTADNQKKYNKILNNIKIKPIRFTNGKATE